MPHAFILRMDYCEAFTSFKAAYGRVKYTLINASYSVGVIHFLPHATCIYIFTLINYVRSKCFVGEVSEHCMYMYMYMYL